MFSSSLTFSSALLLLLVTAGVAETVSRHAAVKDRITALSTIDVRGQREPRIRSRSIGRADSTLEDQLQLLDVVLVASVDGKFHALNRTTGRTLWSMSSGSASPSTVPSMFGPLVRTDHVDSDPDLTDDDGAGQELYIIEPQSGDIYVMNTPSSPLQRLDLSVPQLVDMSPFSFSEVNDRRVFVGKKETSLILIELETGKVKATLNSECPWDPFENLSEMEPSDLDLDELEDVHPPKRTEVYIGRTDYHVSIHTRPLNPSSRRPPIQNLSFSTYGPNNQDSAIQSLHTRSLDDAYIQSLATGSIISFRIRNDGAGGLGEPTKAQDSQLLWARTFSSPIVAVFDVLQSAGRQQPFVLLQPPSRLTDVLPTQDLLAAAHANRLPHIGSAYVGLVEESGALFAMSPEHFPLVAFGDTDAAQGGGSPWIDSGASTGWGARDPLAAPVEVDAITRARKMRELCAGGVADRRCLTGVRPLAESSRWPIHRLIDGVPSVPLPPESFDVPSAGGQNASVYPNESWLTAPAWLSAPARLLLDGRPGTDSANILWAMISLVIALGYAGVWLVARKMGMKPAMRRESAKDRHQEEREVKIDALVDNERTGDRLSAAQGDFTSPIPSSSSPAPSQREPIQPPLIIQTKPLPSLPPDPPNSQKVLVVRVQAPSTQESDHVHVSQPAPAPDAGEDPGEGDESEREGEGGAVQAKKKGTRRRRGRGGKGKKGAANGAANGAAEGEEAGEELDKEKGEKGEKGGVEEDAKVLTLPASPSPLPPSASLSPESSLVVSETVLGFGSHGTVVFKGSLQGRAVAVKRLLADFVTLAAREVSVLQAADSHPHVVRYFLSHAAGGFTYIALELCPASLADVIERPEEHVQIVRGFDPKRALRQVTQGLRHLHNLKIVHRDIKPHNILIAPSSGGPGGSGGGGGAGGHRMLISDFGLCKRLDVDQTSFAPTAHIAAGTVGWRAPEILRGEVKLDVEGAGADEQSQSSRGSVGTVSGAGASPTNRPARLTKFVDIFALGCLFYYVLTGGGHPFGDRFEREGNIFRDAKDLSGLKRFGEEGAEAAELIGRMLEPEAAKRPDTTACLLHPYFWDPTRRLAFLQDASDRFEIMPRDPRDPLLTILETGAVEVVGTDWHQRLDKVFIENLGKFRKYDGRAVQDLLRALRNKKNHYQDLPENVKRTLGAMPDGFLAYFTHRFPRLLLHVHSVVASTALREESMFRSYFGLAD